MLFIFLLSSVFGLRSLSQNISATARLDSTEYLIGDWIKVKLEVKHPEAVPVTWQLSFDSLEGLEVVEIGKADTQKTGNEWVEKRTLTLAAFDSGIFEIPPFLFTYQQKNSERTDSIYTEPMMVTVNTFPVDTSQAIRPIKAPLEVPFSLWEIRHYLLAAFMLILISNLIYFLYATRKKKINPAVEYMPKQPAHEIAMEKLKKTEEEKLWQKGEIKLYHTKVTDIIREYIERRFSVLALESTTDEILEKSEIRNLKSETQNILKDMLVLADLVKFAKATPLPDENEKCLQLAYQFVKETTENNPQIITGEK